MILTREQRAERAQNILNDAVFKESLSTLKDIYIGAFRKCAVNDHDGRWKYQVALDVIDGVENHLAAVLVQGKLDPRAGQEFQTPTMIEKILRTF